MFTCWRELCLLCIPNLILSQELTDQKFVLLSTLSDTCHSLPPPCSLCVLKVHSGGETRFVIGQAQAGIRKHLPRFGTSACQCWLVVLPLARARVLAAVWVNCPVLQGARMTSGINQLPSFTGESTAVKSWTPFHRSLCHLSVFYF